MRKYEELLNKLRNFNISEQIILLNIFLFILPLIVFVFFYLFKIPKINLYHYFELIPDITSLLFRPWSLITYGFIHASIGHLFWNMFLFYFFSSLFLNLFREEELLALFCLGIIFGGLLFVFSYSFFPVFKGINSPLVGSSAGVISVVIFMCTYTPNSTMKIFFFNIKLLYIGILIIIFDLAQLPISNSGGHIAHLGGALLGFFAGSKMKKGENIFWYFKKNLSAKKNKNKKKLTRHDNHKKYNQQKVDRILDKISESGFDSLTSEEKKDLNEASKD